MPIITELLTSMTCVNDVSDLYLEGMNGLASHKGTTLTVTLKRCKEVEPWQAEPRCKSEYEIDFINPERTSSSDKLPRNVLLTPKLQVAHETCEATQ